MTRHHINQGTFADAFAQAKPLRVKTPWRGFEFCEDCHGSGQLFGPPRCCRECGGTGQRLKPELRR